MKSLIKIINSIQINFDNKKILYIIITLQFTFLGLIGIDRIGLEIPVLRQVVGFIYLTFIPGSLILGILKIRDISKINGLLYSVGLSISFLMFIGALINFLYPLFNVSKPISETPLIMTISGVVSLLFYVWYLMNEKKPFSISINTISDIIRPNHIRVLLLMPFLSIVGALLLNFYNNNILLLLLFICISIIPLAVIFDRVPENTYPLAVWVISISLLFQITLASSYLAVGRDISTEFSLALKTKTNGIWNSATEYNFNNLLSITMLQPIYSILTNLNMNWTMKIIYPLIYSFVPLIAFQCFRKQFNDKKAFLSAFLIMVFYSFYTLLSMSIRSGVAELFIMLIFLVISEKNMSLLNKRILLIVYIFSLVVSHYTTIFIFLYLLISINLIFYILKHHISFEDNIILSPTLSVLTFIFTMSWYVHNSGLRYLNFFVSGTYRSINLIYLLFTSVKMDGSVAKYMSQELPLSIQMSKYLLIFITMFIGVGLVNILWMLIKKKEMELQYETVCYMIFFYGLLSMGLLVRVLNISRLGHISILILAPLCIQGIEKTFNLLSKNIKDKHIYLFTSAMFIALFLFSSGFFSETLIRGNDYSPSILISKKRIMTMILDNPMAIEAQKFLYQILIENQEH